MTSTSATEICVFHKVESSQISRGCHLPFSSPNYVINSFSHHGRSRIRQSLLFPPSHYTFTFNMVCTSSFYMFSFVDPHISQRVFPRCSDG